MILSEFRCVISGEGGGRLLRPLDYGEIEAVSSHNNEAEPFIRVYPPPNEGFFWKSWLGSIFIHAWNVMIEAVRRFGALLWQYCRSPVVPNGTLTSWGILMISEIIFISIFYFYFSFALKWDLKYFKCDLICCLSLFSRI